ncbi:MAG: M23 family metallopeptidase [Deltaproteobacteria bacterium]|nr:M23 family metallopeptidase [Deltaproteobacteria bacterium]
MSFREALGLGEPLPRLKEAWIALRGADSVPPSRFGLSSLRQLHPKIAPPLWFGRQVVERKVILTNLFNHEQSPIEEGWSVKKTRVRDFRGGTLSYDSHNGTDFAIPVGTVVTAAAPARVVRRYVEYNRGGFKLILDHGGGLFTCYAHLARPLVEEGARLERGQAIALSGYSGLDALVTLLFGVPHVHFNVWHDAEPVDPFPHDGEASLWRGGDLPVPAGQDEPFDFQPTLFDAAAVSEAIEACKTAATREALQAIEDPYLRGATLVSEWNYYPTRFPLRPRIVREPRPREGVLTLPFEAERFDGVVFADEL